MPRAATPFKRSMDAAEQPRAAHTDPGAPSDKHFGIDSPKP